MGDFAPASYYPSMSIDHNWKITEMNEAMRMVMRQTLPEAGVVAPEMHFLEYLFTEEVRKLLGGSWQEHVLLTCRAYVASQNLPIQKCSTETEKWKNQEIGKWVNWAREQPPMALEDPFSFQHMCDLYINYRHPGGVREIVLQFDNRVCLAPTQRSILVAPYDSPNPVKPETANVTEVVLILMNLLQHTDRVTHGLNSIGWWHIAVQTIIRCLEAKRRKSSCDPLLVFKQVADSINATPWALIEAVHDLASWIPQIPEGSSQDQPTASRTEFLYWLTEMSDVEGSSSIANLIRTAHASIRSSDKFPPTFPSYTVDELWNLTSANSSYLLMTQRLLRLLGKGPLPNWQPGQVHLFDVLFHPAIRDLMGNGEKWKRNVELKLDMFKASVAPYLARYPHKRSQCEKIITRLGQAFPEFMDLYRSVEKTTYPATLHGPEPFAAVYLFLPTGRQLLFLNTMQYVTKDLPHHSFTLVPADDYTRRALTVLLEESDEAISYHILLEEYAAPYNIHMRREQDFSRHPEALINDSEKAISPLMDVATIGQQERRKDETVLDQPQPSETSPSRVVHNNSEEGFSFLANEIAALRRELGEFRADITDIRAMLQEITKSQVLKSKPIESRQSGPPGPGWISVKEAAKLLGISRPRMQQVIADHLVHGIKLGNLWYVDQSSLEQFTPPGTGHRVANLHATDRSSK